MEHASQSGLSRTAATPSFLAGGGDMGARIRAYDWASTPLGPPAQWPQSLKTAIRIMLTSRQPIWIGWGESLIFFYNDPYKSIIGGKHPSALGRPTVEVWQEIWEDIGPLLETAMRGTEGTYVEERLLLMERNGYPEETYYTFSYSPIPDDGGGAGGIICANSDDTARVIGERQVRLLRELAAVSTQSGSWDEACRLSVQALTLNPQDLPFAMLYIAPAQSDTAVLLGCAGIDADHPAVPAELEAGRNAAWPIGEALRRQQLFVLEDLPTHFGATLPRGPWRHAPTRAALLPITPSADTGRAGVLIVGLNPYRLLDESYRGFLDLVAGQIGAAIGHAHAYEEERRRARALAEIDRAKTLFFSNISHEFRTPLTLMLGPLEELLHRAADGDGERPLLDLTYRNGLRLLKLVNSLFDFSRIEAGRVQARYQPTDLAALTAELASLFRSATDKAGLRLVVDCPALPAPVQVDRDMWEKIVLNLLSNAFKFTLDGEIRVALRAAPDGKSVRMQVSDTGIGIPAHELPRVFDRFHRVTGAVGRTIEGSGIGLALVQELVRLQGGAIQVESEQGVGTTFTVTLPLGSSQRLEDADANAGGTAGSSINAQAYVADALRWLPDGEGAKADAPSLSSVLGAAAGEAAGAAERVLVVDDNADLRDYVGRILATAGYRVETAVDGEAALEAARRAPPSLVLSDVMMPRLDGYGLLAAVRGTPELREIPVLLMSARAGEEARVEGLDAGADDYLTKPFSARELLARVASNIKMYRLRQDTARQLRDDAHVLEVLNRVGTTIAAELDLNRAVQVVTDAATELTGAAFGAFFYNVLDDRGESYMLYTLSGVPREAFKGFPMPRNTAVFGPTFSGEGVVRSDDITKDARYGHNAPHHGMPKGHLPVRSYLAVPVVSRGGEVLGGLFLGHPEPGVFSEQAERLISGVAAQAAIAIDNARLYQAAQSEIGQRAEAEQALRQLNETLEMRVAEAVAERERLWELSADLLAVGDFEGRLIRVSPSWTRLLGHTEEFLLASHYGELLHPEDVETGAQAMRTLRDHGGSASYEGRMRTADGGWRWIAWTLSADPEHKDVHGVGRDVTADKEAADALRQAEETLRMAQKMEAVGKLTGGIAHDFNNLLQVIGGNLQLLARDVAGQERAEKRVRSALAGVARGSKLASQLLAFGRRQPLAPKVVNLGRFIRGLDDMLRRALGDGVEVETIVSGGLWNTLVDPFQVENALLNLAINARDAMGGHGKLTIEAGNALLDDDYVARHADVAPGQYVMVAVTDTGTGMTPDVLEHVFEPFFTTKPEGQGTGLGLSMVYGFIKQSNGHIKIYSEPGHGTSVRFYLPRVRQEEDLTTEMDTGPIAGGTETILVAEDDEEVRATVVEMLAELGYRVLKAKDAQSALAIVESGVPIDLLFTDVVMPGPLRSPELARKTRERLPNVAVLFTSGYTENAIVHGGRLDEGIDLLSKPYTREALARKIRHVLRNQQQRNSARQSRQGQLSLSQDQPDMPASVTSMRVLLVEDDGLIRAATAEMLETLGHQVVTAGHASTALAALEEGPVDVLMTDIGLPEISGIELAQKARERRPGLHVVFASGQDPGAMAGASVADAVHLLKPYTAEDLARVFASLR
ncbi:response regulator [Bordetella genomosp. 9]|uniref:histidine kinase n=1 Tax=Bordetella genomosp. 9 TaxID=1416803 RepID=A0A1W6Z0E6_9BORD|nr:response regulator [Bordetella genomosp. 9]ARP86721.1 two-component system sensor histidine kinase/response regulator [Bordetella genomosp. 9]